MSDEQKSELVLRTAIILGKNTRGMNLVDIIAELVEVINTQENMLKLFFKE